MRQTVPSGTPAGIPLTVMPVRPDAVISTGSLATPVRLVPSPRQAEEPRTLTTTSGTTGVTPSRAHDPMADAEVPERPDAVKDCGGRVAGALLDPHGELSRRVRRAE